MAVATITTPLVDLYQSYLMRAALIADHRPLVALGRADGIIAEFVVEEGREYVALHFRNYGQSTARNTQIETWPGVFAPGAGPVIVKIPVPEEMRNGPDIPPGFPIVHHQSYPGATREELEAGTKLLIITGRVRYTDASLTYCENFSLGYPRRVGPEFTLMSISTHDACDRFADSVTFRKKSQETDQRARTKPAQ